MVTYLMLEGIHGFSDTTIYMNGAYMIYPGKLVLINYMIIVNYAANTLQILMSSFNMV